MKFCGLVGYCESVEGTGEWGKGKWTDVVTERKRYGDIVRNNRRYSPNSDTVNDELTLSHTISIVADAYMMEHYYAIKYVLWKGQRWKVTEIQVERPRLILTIGGLYNGPTPESTANSGESV